MKILTTLFSWEKNTLSCFPFSYFFYLKGTLDTTGMLRKKATITQKLLFCHFLTKRLQSSEFQANSIQEYYNSLRLKITKNQT
jgi:hypothetical protein